MAQKRPGKSRRRSSKPQRGRKTTPAALVFFAGVAVAAVALLFVYAFYYLPGQQAPKVPAKPAAQAPAPAAPQAPAQVQAPAPAAQQGQSSTQTTTQTTTQAPAEPAPQIPAPPPADKPGSPRLTIVIDDLGGSLDQAKDILELGLPITFSILPNLTHTKDVDALAAKAGMEIILHQPMQANGTAAAARDTLRPGMTVPETAAILSEHLSQLPHAIGVSNHEGSKATEDPVLMAAVMAELKAKNLFFLDSLTTPKSAGLKEAAKAGVPALVRTVFLDNERGQQAALLMLAQAEHEARTKGRAVAIGHPHPETIAALAAWSVRRDKGIQVVTLTRQLKGN